MSNVKISYNNSEAQTIIEIPTTLKQEKTELAIFDILGHEVTTVPVGNDNTAVLENEAVSHGIYFYRIFQGGSLVACGKLAVE